LPRWSTRRCPGTRRGRPGPQSSPR
jgi:hypothetical protein